MTARPDCDKGFVLFGHSDWSVSWMQFHRQLLVELAALGWNVLWVGSYISGRRDGWFSWLKTAPLGELIREGQCRQFRPWTLPGYRLDHFVPLWSAVQLPALRAVYRQLGFRRPAVMVMAPSELPLVRMSPHGPSLYWTGDEVIMPGEPALLQYVDRILAVSELCYQRHQPQYEDKLVRFSTGVPFRLYNSALSSDYVPPDLRGIARPIIGYAGSVTAGRVELQVFPEQARRHPGLSFVVVGPMDAEARAFFERFRAPNLHVLGPKPYSEVPHYIKSFDVGLVPYQLTPFNLAANPLKLYEYMALGKPVVSSPLPAALALGDAVWIAADADELAHYIGVALADREASRVEQRIEIALAHGTERLARKLATLVDGLADRSALR